MKLYTYYRSSASYRVRIALALKNIPYENKFVHLVKDGGQQFKDEYKKLNPQCLVPSLETDQGVLTQSMAILEYIEECYPEPALLPREPHQRAIVRSMAQLIASDIHPLNNLRVLKYLKHACEISDETKTLWYQHWVKTGFEALEILIAQHGGRCCFGDEVTFADINLIPQVYNAERFHCSLENFPRIQAINAYCLSLEAFQQAKPESQGDFDGSV